MDLALVQPVSNDPAGIDENGWIDEVVALAAVYPDALKHCTVLGMVHAAFLTALAYAYGDQSAI